MSDQPPTTPTTTPPGAWPRLVRIEHKIDLILEMLSAMRPDEAGSSSGPSAPVAGSSEMPPPAAVPPELTRRDER